jgi:hypothetical protein
MHKQSFYSFEKPGCFEANLKDDLFADYLRDIKSEYNQHVRRKNDKRDLMHRIKNEERSSMITFEEEFTSRSVNS